MLIAFLLVILTASAGAARESRETFQEEALVRPLGGGAGHFPILCYDLLVRNTKKARPPDSRRAKPETQPSVLS